MYSRRVREAGDRQPAPPSSTAAAAGWPSCLEPSTAGHARPPPCSHPPRRCGS